MKPTVQVEKGDQPRKGLNHTDLGVRPLQGRGKKEAASFRGFHPPLVKPSKTFVFFPFGETLWTIVNTFTKKSLFFVTEFRACMGPGGVFRRLRVATSPGSHAPPRRVLMSPRPASPRLRVPASLYKILPSRLELGAGELTAVVGLNRGGSKQRKTRAGQVREREEGLLGETRKRDAAAIAEPAKALSAAFSSTSRPLIPRP